MASVIDDLKNTFRKPNNQIIQLILINCIVFFVIILVNFFISFSSNSEQLHNLVNENVFLNANIKQFISHPWTIGIFLFTNEGFLNLLFNSIALFFFGVLIQDFIGGRKLIAVYVMGGVFAALFYMAAFTLISISNLKNNLNPVIFGAQPAFYAVMYASVALIPDYEMFLFRIIRLKIKYLALAFLLLSFFSATHGVLNLGGAIFGYIYIKLLRMGIDLSSPFDAIGSWIGGLGKPKPKMKVSYKKFSTSTVGSKAGGTSHEHHVEGDLDQSEVDALLDKISVSGYDSLSKEEKQRLFLASKKLD